MYYMSLPHTYVLYVCNIYICIIHTYVYITYVHVCISFAHGYASVIMHGSKSANGISHLVSAAIVVETSYIPSMYVYLM